MGDWNRLKELVRPLDCQNPDPMAIKVIDEILVGLNTDAYEKATGGNPGVPVFDTGVADRIHTLFIRFKTADTSVLERQSIIGDILKTIDEVLNSRE